MRKVYKILFVEDDKEQIEFIKFELKQFTIGGGRSVSAVYVSTIEDAKNAMEKHEFDFAILDVHLKSSTKGGRDNTGLKLIKECKQKKIIVGVVSSDPEHERYTKVSKTLSADFFFPKSPKINYIRASVIKAINIIEIKKIDDYIVQNFVTRDNGLREEIAKVLSDVESKKIVIIHGSEGSGRDYIASTISKYWGLKKYVADLQVKVDINIERKNNAIIVPKTSAFSDRKLNELFNVYTNTPSNVALILISSVSPHKLIARFKDSREIKGNELILSVQSLQKRSKDIPFFVDKFIGDVVEDVRVAKTLAKKVKYRSIEEIKEWCNLLKAKSYQTHSADSVKAYAKRLAKESEVGLGLNDNVNRYKIEHMIAVVNESQGSAEKAAQKLGISSSYLRRIFKKNNINGFFNTFNKFSKSKKPGRDNEE